MSFLNVIQKNGTIYTYIMIHFGIYVRIIKHFGIYVRIIDNFGMHAEILFFSFKSLPQGYVFFISQFISKIIWTGS